MIIEIVVPFLRPRTTKNPPFFVHEPGSTDVIAKPNIIKYTNDLLPCHAVWSKYPFYSLQCLKKMRNRSDIHNFRRTFRISHPSTWMKSSESANLRF